jgi:hypothetical protein
MGNLSKFAARCALRRQVTEMGTCREVRSQLPITRFFAQVAYFRVARLSGGMNDLFCYTPSVPARREKDTSLRVKNHIVIGTADEDTAEEQCREQTVFTPPWDILSNVHWGHE